MEKKNDGLIKRDLFEGILVFLLYNRLFLKFLKHNMYIFFLQEKHNIF